MSRRINIDGSDDPFYRYTRPSIITGAQKGGTLVLNTREVAHSLGVLPKNLARCLSVYINRTVILKTDRNGTRLFITGNVSVSEIEDGIFQLTKDIILCRICGNPETKIRNKKQRCQACGGKTKISDMQLPERIENFLSKL